MYLVHSGFFQYNKDIEKKISAAAIAGCRAVLSQGKRTARTNHPVCDMQTNDVVNALKSWFAIYFLGATVPAEKGVLYQ